MSVVNQSFEIGGTDPSIAASWVIVSQSVNTDFAEFTSDVDGALAPERGFESFERWFEVGNLNGAITALFGPPPGNALDDFESDWLNNTYDTGFEPQLLVVAEFDAVPEELEDYEESWDNDSYATDISQVSTVLASFDTGVPQNFEDYEEEWNNDPYFTDISQVSTILASFDTGVPENFEDFEEEWTLTMTTI